MMKKYDCIRISASNWVRFNTDTWTIFLVPSLYALSKLTQLNTGTPIIRTPSMALSVSFLSVITGFDCNHSSCNSKIHRRIDEWCTIVAVKVHHTRCAVNWATQKCTSRDPTKLRRPRQRQKVALMSKTTTLHVHDAFLYISLPSLACTTTTWNDQSLSWVENGNGKAINFTISLWTQKRFPLFSSNLAFLRSSNWVTWYNGKSFKGREIYFSATFSLASPLSDRKVPSNTYGRLYNTNISLGWILQLVIYFSLHERESKSLGFWIAVGSGFSVSRTWIPDSNCQWYLRFLRSILNYKAQDSRFHKQKFPGLRNPDSLTWGEYSLI